MGDPHRFQPPSRPTPLQPREFFTGRWSGEGHLVPLGLLRLFARVQRFTYVSTTRWRDEAHWDIFDRIHYESGKVVEQQLTAELVAADRVRIAAPDMPGGAAIQLRVDGYDFTPYRYRLKAWLLAVTLRCYDVNRLQGDGTVMDSIQMHWLGLPVALMTMRIRIERPTRPPAVDGPSGRNTGQYCNDDDSTGGRMGN